MRRFAYALLFTLVTVPVPVFGQLSASGSVPISLRIPSSITLSLRSVPVSVEVKDGAQSTFSVPLQLNWNVDPREVPAFRVVAYFQNAKAALIETAGAQMIPATDVMSRWSSGEFLRFSSDAAVTLFYTTVVPNLRRGQKQDALELRIADEAVSLLPDGDYQGILYLEVRNY